MGTKTITPRTHNDGQIGSASKYWNKGYFNELNANTLNLTTLELSGVLAVSEGGTGASTHTSACILVGDAGNAIKSYTDLRYYTDTETLKIGDLDNGPATIERHAGFNSPLGDLDIKAPIPYAGSTNFAGGNLNLHAGASSGNQNGGEVKFWASQPSVGSGTTIRNTSVVATIGYNGLYFAENSGKITFEGSTPNNFETTLRVADPTADRTITFPDATGTVALTSGIPTNTNLANTDLTLTGARIHNMGGNSFVFRDGASASDAILSLDPGGNEISFGAAGAASNVEVYHFYSADLNPDFRIYEKASHGSNYGKFTYAGALGGDRTYTLPDATGTVALTSDITNTTLNGTTVGGVATYASANTLDINAKFTWNGSDLVLESSVNQKPDVRIVATASTNKPSSLTFVKDDGAQSGANDYIGSIFFSAQNSTPAETYFAEISGDIGGNTTAGSEVGLLGIKIATSNGSTKSMRHGIRMVGHGSNGSVSTIVSYGSLSTTTISGSLEITSGLTFDSVALNGILTSSEAFSDTDTKLMTAAAIDDRINASAPVQKGWLQWYYNTANLSVVNGYYMEKWNDNYGVTRNSDIADYTDVAASHWKIIRYSRIVPYDLTLTKFIANVEHSGTEDQVEVALWKGVLDDSSVQSSSATTAIAHLCTLTFDGDVDGGTVLAKTQSQSTTSFNSTSLNQGDYLFVTLRRTQSNDGSYYHVHSTALFNY